MREALFLGCFVVGKSACQPGQPRVDKATVEKGGRLSIMASFCFR